MYRLQIERLDHQARGIAKINNKIIFIPKCLPNEIVEADIVLEKKKFYEGKIVKIINADKKRIDAICPHFADCGGCQLLHLKYEDALDFKQNKVEEIIKRNILSKFTINKIITSTDNLFYRNKITLQVNNEIGYFKEKTNSIIPIDTCYIADKNINKIYQIIKNKIDLTNINQVIIRSSKKTQESMVIFKTINKVDQNQIKNTLKDFVNSIYIDDTLVFGIDKITEELLDCKFYISPTSFFQVNTLQAEKLYKIALEYADINRNDLVLDLYCGTGTIAILASQYANKVVGVELNKEAVKDAKLNKGLNNISNVEFYAGDVGEILKKNNYQPDIIIVDPPRAGLDEKAISEILKIKPKKLVYVSCDLMTLARDLKILEEEFKIIELTPVDMFPQTNHVECVVLLQLSSMIEER